MKLRGKRPCIRDLGSSHSAETGKFHTRGTDPSYICRLFAMFDWPFTHGAPWGAEDDSAHAPVAVITARMNDRVFGGGNSVGKMLRIGNRLSSSRYNRHGPAEVLRPQHRILGGPEQISGYRLRAPSRISWEAANLRCLPGADASSWEGVLRSECIWIEFWPSCPTRQPHGDIVR